MAQGTESVIKGVLIVVMGVALHDATTYLEIKVPTTFQNHREQETAGQGRHER
jgi:hypothetical protein